MANLNGNQKRNSISAIPAYDVVLKRDSREEEGPIIIDLHAITSVPGNHVMWTLPRFSAFIKRRFAEFTELLHAKGALEFDTLIWALPQF